MSSEARFAQKNVQKALKKAVCPNAEKIFKARIKAALLSGVCLVLKFGLCSSVTASVWFSTASEAILEFGSTANSKHPLQYTVFFLIYNLYIYKKLKSTKIMYEATNSV